MVSRKTAIGRLALPGKNQNGEPGGSPFQRFFFAVAALISASGGTHRVRGVMVAVCVLSPVESSSPPQLFEQQFPCTPVPRVWQGRLCNFHYLGIKRHWAAISRLLSTISGELAIAGLFNEEAFAKLIASNKHFGSAVPGK